MEGEVERLNKELGGVREKLDRTQVASKPAKVSVEEGDYSACSILDAQPCALIAVTSVT